MDNCIHEMVPGTCSLCLGLEIRKPVIPVDEQRAAELFDMASSIPSFTAAQACANFDWTESQFHAAVQALRRILSGDTINLVVVQAGAVHLYKLVGDLASALPWATRRLRSVESQLMTLGNVTASIVNATRANSYEGKRARIIAAQMNILQLQLDNLKD